MKEAIADMLTIESTKTRKRSIELKPNNHYYHNLHNFTGAKTSKHTSSNLDPKKLDKMRNQNFVKTVPEFESYF